MDINVDGSNIVELAKRDEMETLMTQVWTPGKPKHSIDDVKDSNTSVRFVVFVLVAAIAISAELAIAVFFSVDAAFDCALAAIAVTLAALLVASAVEFHSGRTKERKSRHHKR